MRDRSKVILNKTVNHFAPHKNNKIYRLKILE